MEPDASEEFSSPLIDPWECTFRFEVSDRKKVVISKIWDGYAYPKAIRDKVDISNKTVKIISKDGKVYSYDKDSFRLPREYLQIRDGGIYYEGIG